MADLRDYLGAAFNARPLGMPVPPNWLGLAACGLLGLVNPGFWIIGAGLEAGYLFWLSHSPRFRAVVDGRQQQTRNRDEAERWTTSRARLVEQLPTADRRRLTILEERCHEVLDQQARLDAGGVEMQRNGLGRMVWVYLRLLAGRASIARLVDEASDGEADRLQKKAKDLIARLAGKDLSDDLRRSMQGQLEIVQSRLARQREAGDKLAFIDAELSRIDEQVGLLRDQALLAADPQAVAARIDEIGATLGETTAWIGRQQALLGSTMDEPVDALPLAEAAPRARTTAKETT